MTINELLQALHTDKSAVIAIDGPSGSGKSTLASLLKDQFDAQLFHTDDYFLPAVRKTDKRLDEPGGNLDYERMEEEIFAHLNDNEITSNHYNCTNETLEDRLPVQRKRIVIVEGVYSMHPRFLRYYDYTVYINIPRMDQYKRILKRSNQQMLERFKKEWIPLEDRYFDAFDIAETADVVLLHDMDFGMLFDA